MTNVNFSGSFMSYMRACFQEINLTKLLLNIYHKISNITAFNNYDIDISDRYLDYEHVIKVTLYKGDIKKSTYIHISKLLMNYDKTLSDMADDLMWTTTSKTTNSVFRFITV